MDANLDRMLAAVHQRANRLHGILIRCGSVRVRIGELTDSIDRTTAALDFTEGLDLQAVNDVTNAARQLEMFLGDFGNGLEQGGETALRPRIERATLMHLSRWIEYLGGLAEALEAESAVEWMVQHAPPPGQPSIPRRT